MAVRHIVMWTLHDPANAPRFKALLDTCQGLITGMREFQVGIREPGLDANCDVVLVSTFDTADALEAYQVHPVHKAVSAELGPMRVARQVLDYVI
jgi:Stress responsive A/B Barrel Domain